MTMLRHSVRNLFASLRRSAPGGRRPGRPRRWAYRPWLEGLEELVLPSTVRWINPNGGDWNVAANWSAGRVPGVADDAVIDLFGVTVTHQAGNSPVHSLTLTFTTLYLGAGSIKTSTITTGPGAPGTIILVGSIAGPSAQDDIVRVGSGITIRCTQYGSLSGLVLDGTVDLTAAGARVGIVNGMTVNGTILVGNDSGSTYGQIFFSHSPGDFPENIGGPGQIVFGGSPNNLLSIATSNTMVEFESDLTISGKSGKILTQYPSSIYLNAGMINANTAGGSWLVDLGDGAAGTNIGTMEATNGGSLGLEGNWTNSGTIQATSNGLVGLAGVGISSGGVFGGSGGTMYLSGPLTNQNTITLSGTNQFSLARGTIIGGTVIETGGARLTGTTGGGELRGVVLNGDLDLTTVNGANVTVTDGMTLRGTIAVGNPSGSTQGSLYFGTSSRTQDNIAGPGAIVLGGSTGNTLAIINANTTVGLESDLTIKGNSGRVLTDYSTSIYDNGGTISADTAGGSWLVDLGNGAAGINRGLIRATNGAILTLQGNWTNTGTIQAENGSTLAANPPTNYATGTLTGGTWQVLDNSTLRVSMSSGLITNAATLLLDGTNAHFYSDSGSTDALANFITNAAGGSLTVQNGHSVTTHGALSNSGTLVLGPAGIVNVTGSYTQSTAATLQVQLGGPPASGQFGRLNSTGTANLAGTLSAALANGFTLGPGQSFTVMTFSSVSGDFGTTNLPAGLMAGYDSNSLKLFTGVATGGFRVSGFSSPVPAGTAGTFTVTALDTSGNTRTDYRGTVHFTTSDPQAARPADYTFTAADNGVHVFTATLKTAGLQAITSTDTADSSITGTQSGITVMPGATAKFAFVVPTGSTAGAAFTATVTAQDTYGNTTTAYTGTVHFTSSDGQAVLPADMALSNGSGTFSVTLKTAGSQSVRVTDVANGALTGTSPAIQVSPAAASRLTLTAPAGATLGIPFPISLTVLDAYNNVATGYTGTVHFTSSDAQAVLPGNTTLTNGSGTFSITLKTAGTQTVTATDTANGALTASRTIPASAAAVRFLITAPANANAGAAFSITVTALDAADNTAIGYTGTIHFTSSDPQAVLPANTTLTNGTGTFSVTLKTAGKQSVVATDTANTALTGSAFNLTDFGTPTANSGPLGIGAGPDGNVWFIEYRSNKVARITPAGVVTEFAVPTGTPRLSGIVAGADGNLWATEYYPNKIARITPSGVVTEFPIPTSNSGPDGITLGPDGNVWFAEFLAGKVGRVTPAGVVTDFALGSSGAQPVNLAAGPDGNVWFTEAYSNKIGRVTPSGSVTEFGIPSGGSSPVGIAQGADGNLWFTEQNSRRIGRITPAGSITEFVIPATIPGQPYGMAAGADGALWFTMRSGAGRLGRVTVAGAFSDYALPSPNGDPNFITKGPDGNIWFTEYAANKVARFQAGVTVQPGPTASFLVRPAAGTVTAGNSFNVTVTAQDAYGNPIRGYNGTVHFTSNDPQAALPADAMLSNGTGTFSVTLGTAGPQTITVTDTGNGAITGTSSAIQVNPGAAAFFLVTPSVGGVTAGTPFSITVTAFDAYNNVATGYTGTVTFSSTDPQAALPADTPLTNGTGSFSVTLGTVGSQQIVATDTVNSSLTGSANVAVYLINEVPTPTTSAGLAGIAPGSDGNVWFVETAANQIGRITQAGLVTEYPIPTTGAGPYAMTLGPDGNLWFTEANANQIGMINPLSGLIAEFTIPTANSQPEGIIAGQDGNLWFTEAGANQIGMINPQSDLITEYPIPTANSGPNAIAVDSAGNLWFTEAGANQIGEITTAGLVSEYPVPTANSGLSGIALGSDGNLWFTEANANQIGQITTAGAFTEFALPTAGAAPSGITRGQDGNLWFTETNTNQIGQITTAGVITEFAVPTAGSGPLGIAPGPDGNLWFTESAVDQIGQVVIGGPAPSVPNANWRDPLAEPFLLLSPLMQAAEDLPAATGTPTRGVPSSAEASAAPRKSDSTSDDPITALTLLAPDQADQLFSLIGSSLAQDQDADLGGAFSFDGRNGNQL